MNETKKTEPIYEIVGFLIAIPIVGSLLTWYNHIVCANQFGWWRWFILAMPVLFLTRWQKWLRIPLGLMFFAATICQLLYWTNAIALPLFR